MAKGRPKQSTMDLARDELFSHIRRCGVLDAEESERRTWMSDTVEYLRERYPDLSEAEVQQLEQIGHRYCQPAIPFGPAKSSGREVSD